MSGWRSRGVVLVSVVALTVLGTGRLSEPVLPADAGADVVSAVRTGVAEVAAPDPPLPEPVPAPPAGDEVAVAPPPDFGEAPARPAPPREPRSSFEGVVPAGGTWAVVVGANDYPGSEFDLGSAVADAGDVDDALARFGVPADHRLVLRDRQASAAGVAGAVDWLVAHAGPDAVAVLFFAGHVRKLGPTTEALVGTDGGLLPDGELATRLGRLQARRMWIGIAGCYGGGFTELLAPGRVLTAAAGADDLAYENARLGRSYLVEYMVRRGMIQNLAGATVQAAFLFAQSEITRDFPSRIPVMVDLLGAGLDLRPGAAALVGAAPVAPPASPASPAPAPPPTSPPRTCVLGLFC